MKLFALMAASAALLCAAEEVPPWVREVSAIHAPAYTGRVNSVVLLQEEAVTVDAEGRRVMRERGAIRLLQASAERIEAFRTYNTRSGRIRDFQGWLILPNGKTSAYPKNRVVDVAISPRWEEERGKLLEPGMNLPGSIFAWEITEEEKTVFTQYAYAFQSRSPVLVSRLTLTLPVGWEIEATVFNHDPLKPQVSGDTYTWELHDLPWIEPEDYSPSLRALAPRVMVSYFPPSDNRARLKGLRDWTAVSSWLAQLMDGPAEATAPIQARAAQLTAGATGELDKIRALAGFVQAINYVSVDMNVTRGGGYTPHRAEDTLARNYGDCKDKATLMRALLKAERIDAFPVAIYSSDRTFVRPEWASPFQFNHLIVAIRVSDTVALPTVLDRTPLGRLLIFDPTDPITPVGDLPIQEQGSEGLLVSASHGALIKMPLLPPSANRVESTVEAVMDDGGRIEVTLRREYHGQSAAGLREAGKLDGSPELRKIFERGLERSLAGVSLKSLETNPPSGKNPEVKLDFSSDHFGQLMQGHLLIIRPGLLSSGGRYGFAGLPASRHAAIRLAADLRHDAIRIKVPNGFKLDELPQPARIETPFGRLEAKWALQDGQLLMEETVEIRETLAPASEYPKIRDFFRQLSGADGAPVVFVRN